MMDDKLYARIAPVLTLAANDNDELERENRQALFSALGVLLLKHNKQQLLGVVEEMLDYLVDLHGKLDVDEMED